MKAEHTQVKIYRPRVLNGLLRLYSKNPEALLFAGGTEIVPEAASGKARELAFPKKVIYLGNVAELAKISRSQRYLDIGACLSISRILSIGRHIIPRVLFESLRSLGSPSIRNLATLGGNICSSAPTNDSLPALCAIDAQLELKSLSGSRWLPVSNFISGSEAPNLKPGEVLVRIRIPLEEWDYQVFRKVGRRRTSARSIINFAGTARFAKGVLESFHFSFGGLEPGLFRSRALEAELEGGKLPVPAKEVNALVADLQERLKPASSIKGFYKRATALRLVKWFIGELNQKSLEF